MITMAEVGAGAILGLPAVVVDQPYTLTAEALERTSIHFVSRADFLDLIQNKPQLTFKILELLALQVRSVRLLLTGLADTPEI